MTTVWLVLTMWWMQEDPGPPVIKRGPNAPRKKVDNKPATPLPLPASSPPAGEQPSGEAASANAAPANPPTAAATLTELLIPGRPPLLSKAYDIAVEFNATLPNFVCDEIVDRFESGSKPEKWKKKDKVEVEVMYVNGKEDYANPRINGKPFKGVSIEDTGSWSRGDWGTVLIDVLSPASQAEFKQRPAGKDSDKIAGIETLVFDLNVKKANSHWTIAYGTKIQPAYSGSIWVDPLSARVLRIEMQGRNLPQTYELDAVEFTVEYGWVEISGQKYLMPATASNLACRRYTTNCTKNELVFKNYRKFATESSISTTESEISFGDEKPGEAAKPAPAKPGTKKKKK